jgi:hypothetical protein
VLPVWTLTVTLECASYTLLAQGIDLQSLEGRQAIGSQAFGILRVSHLCLSLSVMFDRGVDLRQGLVFVDHHQVGGQFHLPGLANQFGAQGIAYVALGGIPVLFRELDLRRVGDFIDHVGAAVDDDALVLVVSAVKLGVGPGPGRLFNCLRSSRSAILRAARAAPRKGLMRVGGSRVYSLWKPPTDMGLHAQIPNSKYDP